MIDNYLLEELVAVADTGTLSRAAKKVGLSQAALSRGTKKIEHDLGLKLFIRKPNRITLTKTGEFAVEKARQVLQTNNNFSVEVTNFNRSLDQISLASVAPGPLILLKKFTHPNLVINQNLLKPEQVIPALNQRDYTCIINNQKINQDGITSTMLGSEQLIVHLNQFSNLASKQTITFKELTGLSFVVLSNIGIWTDIIQKNIPNAKFLYQQNESNFNEIRNNSIFPFFTTNITQSDSGLNKINDLDRIPIKISDPAASMKFYINYLPENKARLSTLIAKMQQCFTAINK